MLVAGDAMGDDEGSVGSDSPQSFSAGEVEEFLAFGGGESEGVDGVGDLVGLLGVQTITTLVRSVIAAAMAGSI